MQFEKLKNKNGEAFFPVSHASGTYYGTDSSSTVESEISSLKERMPSKTSDIQNDLFVESRLDTTLATRVAPDITHLASQQHVDSNTRKISSLYSDIKDFDAQISAINSRIDTYTSLPTGSTSGDAELIDIRTKYDGTAASSAGSAVREQIRPIAYLIRDLGLSVVNGMLIDSWEGN